MRTHRTIRPQFPRPNVHAIRVCPATGQTIYMENEIMERILGRKLERGEEVRHKNGNTLDNRRSNLELIKRPE